VLEELTQSGVRFYRRRVAVARPHSVGWPGTST